VCQSLTELDSGSVHGEAAKLAAQFKGINCPQRPGFYTFRKEFCFNDWSAFDEDGDCKFDFFQSSEKLRDYKSALASLQQIGFVRFNDVNATCSDQLTDYRAQS
jgi:hypothetical protein